jgi:hypothetical protein
MIKKSMRFIIIAGVIIAILGLFGYTYSADVSALDNARITIRDIRIQEINLIDPKPHCNLIIFIDISNPSNQDITGLTADFDVFITNNYVGSGSVSKISIPAQSSKEKEVSLTIYFFDVAAAVKDVIINGNFIISIKGYASGDVLFGLITITDQISASKSYP